MTLDKFVETIKGDVDKFVDFYKRGIAGPDNYPEEQGVADWYEQFDMYVAAMGEDDEDDNDEENEEDDETCDACDGTGQCNECDGDGCADNETCDAGQCGACEGSGVAPVVE
jgi:hypothetical protein